MRRVYGNNSTNRGFSLVELLVTLGVLAVLIAISIPVLGAVRSAARSAHCLSNTRQSAYTVAAYQADHRDVFPISADRMNYADAFDYAGVRLPYASQLFLWSHAVRASTGGPKLDETRLCPGGTAYQTYVRSGDAAGNLAGTPDGATVGSDYWLSYALLSDPRRWTSTADPDNTTLLRAVRGTEVRYPASKGVLVEYAAQHTRRDGGFLYGARPPEIVVGEPEAARTPRHASFADGSATRVMEARDLTPGITPGLNAVAASVLYTRDGVLGRDRR